MPPEEEPRPAELSRRIDAIGKRLDDGFRDMSARFNEVPTEKTLLAYLAARDAEQRAMRDDIKDLATSLTKETAERRGAIEHERTARETQAKEDRDRAERTRQFFLGFAVTCGVAVTGLAAFIINLAGGPT